MKFLLKLWALSLASWKIFSDFAANKITADVGYVHMLIYYAWVWCRLSALWTDNKTRFDQSMFFFKHGYFIKNHWVLQGSYSIPIWLTGVGVCWNHEEYQKSCRCKCRSNNCNTHCSWLWLKRFARISGTGFKENFSWWVLIAFVQTLLIYLLLMSDV